MKYSNIAPEPFSSGHVSQPAPAGTHLQYEEQGLMKPTETFTHHLGSKRARVRRLPTKTPCFQISDRDPVSNQSFTVLLADPAPDLGKVLGTVQPSPPGTNQWAVVLGAAAVKRLGEDFFSSLRAGEEAVVSIELAFEGTQVTAVQLKSPDRGSRCG